MATKNALNGGVSRTVGDAYWSLMNLAGRYECHVADWKEPHEPWNCPTCGRHFGTSQAVGWPADNPEHPWWSVPQGMGHEEACDYFEKRFGLRQPHV